MKIALRVVGALLGLLLVVGASPLVASESGEVVVLTTTDAQGQAHETRLWVVDLEDQAWLRAGADVQAWYGRLREHPEVAVERNGETRPFTALPQPERRAEINQLMREKYGWADRYIGLLFGRDDAIPIRLEPR